jgi:hypothetical protein
MTSAATGNAFKAINFIDQYFSEAEHGLIRAGELSALATVSDDARVIAAALAAVANALLALRETTGSGALDLASAVTDAGDRVSDIADAIDEAAMPRRQRRRHLRPPFTWRRVEERRFREDINAAVDARRYAGVTGVTGASDDGPAPSSL